MYSLIQQLRIYLLQLDRRVAAWSVLLISFSIYVNYAKGLNQWIKQQPEQMEFAWWYIVFFTVFAFGYALQTLFAREALFRNRRFVLLLLIAPAVFGWKMSYSPSFDVGEDALSREYWNAVIYYPFKLSVIIAMLAVTWLLFNRDESFYGCSMKHFHLQPYLWLLLMMVPLVAAASTQDDFLFTYPKFQTVPFADENGKGFYQLLFELSYGSDFIGIELFFRGFLIVAFMKYAGRGAILPMALFYCTIHFGKPLGECISSFFGGIILGVVSYHTRSIWGGLMVHLGIAWLMELGGYLGNLYMN